MNTKGRDGSSKYTNFYSAGQLWNRVPDENDRYRKPEESAAPTPAFIGGWLIGSETEKTLKILTSSGVTSIPKLPSINIYPGVSNFEMVMAYDGDSTIVVGSYGDGTSAIYSNDKGTTWNPLRWGDGAEIDNTPYFGAYGMDGFIVNTGDYRNYYSWSADGGIPWTFNSSSLNYNNFGSYMGGMIEYNGYLYASMAAGYTNGTIMGVVRTNSVINTNWELVDSGSGSELGNWGTSRNAYPVFANLGSQMIMVSEGGLLRSTTDGSTWSGVSNTAMALETAESISGGYVKTIAAGNGWYVTPDVIRPNRIYAAQSDLNFQVYTIPDIGTSKLRSVSFGGGKFCVVGENATVVTFDTPGNWTIETTDFLTNSTLSGVRYLNL